MKISVHHSCSEFDSYRAARVKSLFNVDSGANVVVEAQLPIDEKPWSLGLVVGPSGSGKSTIGKALFGETALAAMPWPKNRPVIDAIAPEASFDTVAAALAAVGLGTVPAWLRPYEVLSNGERFRAELARVIAQAPERVVIDEFTSVVDRQIARVGAMAFGKAWRRTKGKCVVLSCHHDVAAWLQPDWIYDTGTARFQWGCRRRRSDIEVEIVATDWRFWPIFEPHHYLKMPKMIAATNYVALVDGVPVAHVAFSTRPGLSEARACRLVVMPEWQGAGIGMRFLNAVCEHWRRGENRYGKPLATLFHTSHPGLAAALRRDRRWAQVSASLYGAHKPRSAASFSRGAAKGLCVGGGSGYGGHFRAVQGFRYYGEPA